MRITSPANQKAAEEPRDAAEFLARGISRHDAGEFDDAIADFSAALAADPQNARTLGLRGRSQHYLSEFELALADYNESLRLDPSDSTFLHYRGQLHSADANYQQALADFSEAIRIDPTDADIYFDRGSVYVELGDYDRALTDFTETIRLKPNNPNHYIRRAETWEQLGEFAQASADYLAADQLDSRIDEAPIEDKQVEENHSEAMMSESRILVHSLLQAHFSPVLLNQLTITERQFPGRVRADLQHAIDGLMERMKVCHFCGVRKQYNSDGVNFTELVVRDRNDPPLGVPPQYEEIDIGEAQPLRCLKEGLWLLEDEGSRFAVFLEPEPRYQRSYVVRFQVAAINDEAGIRVTKRFFDHMERAVQEARCYRGKILSLEQEDAYAGTASGIKVHKLRAVEREQVILPPRTLELLERNVIHFVRQRAKLAAWGMATKKGLLFYGPPGTGKTHTLHYLAGALEGMTTLLISAEQIGFLGHYMMLARLLQPSMVVIEDADLIARERSSMNSACEEVMLNMLLNEMDGLKENADILFILTTNRPETLESALRSRPGRIDQAIEFPYPDAEGRAKLVKLYSRGCLVPEHVLAETVRRTENVSAAFIKELLRRSAQFVLERNGEGELTLADVNNALDELLFSGGSLNRTLLGCALETHPDRSV